METKIVSRDCRGIIHKLNSWLAKKTEQGVGKRKK
jgi:hypothetical protein